MPSDGVRKPSHPGAVRAQPGREEVLFPGTHVGLNAMAPAATTNRFRYLCVLSNLLVPHANSIFAVQFCNSYITLYYIAFFKPFAREQSWTFLGNDFECVNDNCFEEVSTHLLAMFCTQLVIQNIINVAAPLCTRRRRPRATTVRTDTGFNEQLIQQDDHSDPDTLHRYIEEAQSPARESLRLPARKFCRCSRLMKS